MANNNSVEPKKKKEKMSVKQIVTTVVIAILALLMVGGLSYVLAGINQKKAEEANVFGKYNGKDIGLAYGNVFYNTLVNNEELMAGSTDFNTIYSAYQEGYRNELMFVAIDELAQKAKIKYTQNVIDDYLINSGLFDDDNGNFSADVYNQYSDALLQQTDAYAKKIYPYSVVIDDYESLLTSPLETSFVTDLVANVTNFEYMVVDFTNYPDEDAAEYGKAHPEEFVELTVSMITVSSEDDAKTVVAALDGGMSWSDAVAQYSLDNYAENDGYIGTVNPWNIKNNLSNADDINKIYELTAGQYSQPIQGLYSWTIYKLDEDIVFEPDFTNARTLTLVKYYISNNDQTVLSENVYATAQEAYAAALVDYDAAAAKYSIYGSIPIGPLSNNAGDSSLLYNFEDYDYYGYLADAVADESASYKELYSAETGAVLGPYGFDDGYVIVRVGEKETAESLQVASFFSTYASSIPSVLINDLSTSVTSSDKFEDNFFSVILNMMLNSQS